MAYKLVVTCIKKPDVKLHPWITAGVAEHCRQTYPNDPFLDTRVVAENTATKWVGNLTFVSEESFDTIYNDPIVKQAKDNWDAYNIENDVSTQLLGSVV